MTESLTLNRSLIIVYFKPAFFEIVKHNLEEGFTLDELNEDPLFFLIPPCNEENLEKVIVEYEEHIIMAAINLFFDEDQTIPPLDESLDDYFEIETYDEVHDLVPKLELTHEDLIDELDDDDEPEATIPT